MVLKVRSLDGKHQHHLGKCKKCTFSGHTSDLPIQKLWGWSPAVCILTCPSSDSVAHSGLGTTALDKCSSFLFNLLTSRLPSPKLFSMLLPGCPSKLLINPAIPFFKTLSQKKKKKNSFPVPHCYWTDYSWYSKFFTHWFRVSSAAPSLPTSPDHSTPPTPAHVHTEAHISTTCPHTKFQSFWSPSVLQVHYRLLVTRGLWPWFLPPEMHLAPALSPTFSCLSVSRSLVFILQGLVLILTYPLQEALPEHSHPCLSWVPLTGVTTECSIYFHHCTHHPELLMCLFSPWL